MLKKFALFNMFNFSCNEKLCESKITLWLNHLLVLYAFLIPIHNKPKSSLFFVMLLLFLYRGNYWKYIKYALLNKVVQAFLLFYVISILGFIYTENIVYAKSSMDKAKYILFPLFFLTFLDKRFTIRIITAFSFGIFFSELVSYAIKLELIPPVFLLHNYEIYSTSVSDPTPFFNHIDHTIGLAVIVSLLAFQLLNKNISTVGKVLTIIFMSSATINMTFIGGRTGYILYITLMLTVFIITYQKNIKKGIIFFSLLILPMIYLTYTYSSMVNMRVNQTISSIQKVINEEDYNSSVGLRIGFTKYSLKVISENPIIGVGTGDYMDEVRAIIPNKYWYLKDKNRIKEPHNVYIQTLLQFGIIGLLSLFYIFYTLLTYSKTSSYNKNMIFILTIAIIIVMLPGKFYGVFVLPMFVTLLSALMARKKYNINYQPFNLKTFLYYLGLIIVFFIIGITR